MIRKEKLTAIIPVRSGSKGIPNKNLYRLYVGPFNNLISLKTAYNDISKLEFENIEMIEQ